MTRIGSLFTGTGELDRAVAEVFGGTVAWVSDIAEHDKRGALIGNSPLILAHRYPHTPNLGDITAVDWSTVEPVDIITGGSPCQDVSHAGRRLGMTTGTRSSLWGSMREAIATLRPRLVVWENVRGVLSARADSSLEHCPGCMGNHHRTEPALRAFGRVLGDLADLGFDAEWCGLPASRVGACHGRFRVFVVAHSRGETVQEWRRLRPVDEGGVGWRRPDHDPRQTGPVTLLPTAAGWGPHAQAIARHELLVGRAAPAATETGPRGNPRLSARFAEWMMCCPDGWVTDVPGLTRPQQIRALGNGVVAAQAAAAIRQALNIWQETAA